MPWLFFPIILVNKIERGYKTAAVNCCCYYYYYYIIINNVLGDNETHLERILRRMEEKGISRKGKEKNEGEVTRNAINDAGTVTYMKLLYKGYVHGRYCHVYYCEVLDWMIAFVTPFTFTHYRTIDNAALLHFYTLSNSLLHTH